MIYGDRIRQAREYCGLTQTELAKKVEVNQSAIAHLESGRNIPTEDLLTTIAEKTGFRIDYCAQKHPSLAKFAATLRWLSIQP